MNKSNFVLTLLLVALIGALGYIVYDKVLYAPSNPSVIVVNTTTTEPVVCTMDAKLCPDGSYVGRTGPKCEFAACPAETSVPGTESWKTSAAEGMSFRYPEQLGTTYIQTAEWPPTLQLAASLATPFTCVDSKSRTIGGQLYCVKTTTEGAAGSIYSTYEYATEVNDATQGRNVYVFKFSLRAPQCVNYDDPKKTECTNEEKTFSIDNLVEKMTKTVKFVSIP